VDLNSIPGPALDAHYNGTCICLQTICFTAEHKYMHVIITVRSSLPDLQVVSGTVELIEI
jgi:hypothetical protein